MAEYIGFILGIIIGIGLMGGAFGAIIFGIAKLLKKDIAFPACLGIGMLVSLVSFLIL